MSWLKFLKDASGCWVEKRLKRIKGGGWETG